MLHQPSLPAAVGTLGPAGHRVVRPAVPGLPVSLPSTIHVSDHALFHRSSLPAAVGGVAVPIAMESGSCVVRAGSRPDIPTVPGSTWIDKQDTPKKII